MARCDKQGVADLPYRASRELVRKKNPNLLTLVYPHVYSIHTNPFIQSVMLYCLYFLSFNKNCSQ